MATSRQMIPLSYAPGNDDAALVLAELARLPPRQRSATIWAWCAAYLRGQARAAPPEAAEDPDAALDALLDAL